MNAFRYQFYGVTFSLTNSAEATLSILAKASSGFKCSPDLHISPACGGARKGSDICFPKMGVRLLRNGRSFLCECGKPFTLTVELRIFIYSHSVQTFVLIKDKRTCEHTMAVAGTIVLAPNSSSQH